MPRGAFPNTIVTASDGSLWFNYAMRPGLGRITLAGVMTRYRGVRAGALAAGPNGRVWFIDVRSSGGPWIGFITTSGRVRRFRVPRTPWPLALVVGAGGDIWYTTDAAAIGRLTPAGRLRLFRLRGLGRSALTDEITVGPDGSAWFTAYRTDDPRTRNSLRIGRITPRGVVRLFPIPGATYSPGGITADAHGDIWFTAPFPARWSIRDGVGRLTQAGALTVYPGPEIVASGPITAGPDDNVWFTGADALWRMSRDGAITRFSEGVSPGADPNRITAGADGSLWFTEFYGNRIGRITPGGVVSEFPPTALATRIRLIGARALTAILECPVGAPWRCRGTAALMVGSGPGALRVGVRPISVAAGARARLVVPLSAAARARLARIGMLAGHVVVTPTSVPGSGVVQTPFRLRRRPAR